jgi:hypothetical protein
MIRSSCDRRVNKEKRDEILSTLILEFSIVVGLS